MPLGLLRVRDDVIVLHQMMWPDEIRDPAQLAPAPVELTDEEIDEAMLLIDRMDLDGLDGFRDRYTDALNELLAAKREGHELPEVPEPGQAPGRVVDLMDALQESVARARASPAVRTPRPTSTRCRNPGRRRQPRRPRRPR